MMKLRWGLIGSSTIAAEHMIGAFRANGGEAVAVMSTNADRAASYAKKHGIAYATTSLKELVESKDVDAVYISTTNELHRDQLFAAATAGKHVLCEKPLALTLPDARAMVGECRKRDVVVGPTITSATRATHCAMRESVNCRSFFLISQAIGRAQIARSTSLANKGRQARHAGVSLSHSPQARTANSSVRWWADAWSTRSRRPKSASESQH
jgi:predicted dehydrogenase